MPQLNCWSVTIYDEGVYSAPELRTFHLQGLVSEHPDFEEGHHITTSRIVGKVGEDIITRSGTVYTLGDVDPKYEALYPDAKRRLLASLT
jgi:hypothetical protein